MQLNIRSLYILLIFLIGLSNFAFAQKLPKKKTAYDYQREPINADVVDSTRITKEPTVLMLRPWVGLGVGNLAFFGDIQKVKAESPVINRISYELYLSQDLTKAFNLGLYFMTGRINVSGVDTRKYFNLDSKINLGGAHLTYNFHHLLWPYRYIEPYVTVGFEGFEYLSKTDSKDKYGNTYYYWEDGSIRNVDEQSPEYYKAQIIQRDGIYETDLRTANLDGLGKYKEFAFAIPVGGGITLKLHEKLKFNFGTTFHLATTDLVDNLSKAGTGIRQGKKGSDKMMMTSVSLHYNLTRKKELAIMEEDDYMNFLIADGDGDYDTDGVLDFVDSAALTPIGVKVTKYGVPFDNDRDGIENFRDEELYSKQAAIVHTDGIELTDSLMQAFYDLYMDSLGKFNNNVEVLSDIKASTDGGNYFKVLLGEYKSGVPSDLINKFLSLTDIVNQQQPDSSVAFTSGAYRQYQAAKARLETVKGIGIEGAKVVVHKDGKFIPVDDSNYQEYEVKEAFAASATNSGTPVNPNNTSSQENTSQNNNNANNVASNEKGVIYRIQLGAYKKKISNQVFGGINDLMGITGDDGVTRYVSGNFTDYNEAAKHRIYMVTKGFGGAFITAFKDGKRVSLESTGVKLNKSNAVEDTTLHSAASKKMIVFKVQLGVYKGEVPADMQKIFKSLSGIEEGTTVTGLKRLTLGKFNNYKQAQAFKTEMINKGVKDAFIISFFNDQQIDIQEALELLK